MNRLLACGIVAGPLFVGLALLQAYTRDGFDLRRHPISLLSLGDLGWLQIANFVCTGALLVAFSVGLRRALYPGPAGTWAPRLVAAMGAGLAIAGVFLTDAGAGYPEGAPAGAPESVSWHGIVHELGFAISTVAWFAACFVLLRRFAAQGRRGWVAVCIAAPVAVLVVDGWPHLESLSWRLVIGTAISFAFLAAIAVHLRTTAMR
jgi:hypothetical protein